jgi:hypothetical protein
MPAGVNRPSLFICTDTPDFPEMTECRASAWAFGNFAERSRDEYPLGSEFSLRPLAALPVECSKYFSPLPGRGATHWAHL